MSTGKVTSGKVFANWNSTSVMGPVVHLFGSAGSCVGFYGLGQIDDAIATLQEARQALVFAVDNPAPTPFHFLGAEAEAV